MDRDGVSVVPATRDDIPAIVALHREVFADYFLPNLGGDVLRRMYAFYMDSPAGFVRVAKQNGEIVGFLLGSTDDKAFIMYHFKKKNRLFLFLRVLRALLCLNRVIWHDIFKKVRAHFSIQKSVKRRMSAAAHPAAGAAAGARADSGKAAQTERGKAQGIFGGIESLGVKSSCRRSGAAGKLVECFEAALRDASVGNYRLMVKETNDAAIGFYHKLGMHIRYRVDGYICYEKALTPPDGE